MQELPEDAKKSLDEMMEIIKLVRQFPVREPPPPPPPMRWTRNPIYVRRGYKGWLPSGTVVEV